MSDRIRPVNDGIGLFGHSYEKMKDIRFYSENGTVQLWCEISLGEQTALQFLTPEEALAFAEAFKRCAENALEQQKPVVTPEIEYAARKLYELMNDQHGAQAPRWERLERGIQDLYYIRVRTVLESVRDPSYASIVVGNMTQSQDRLTIWQAMIDAVLGKAK